MPIHFWPTDDRPREKLLRQGASTLTDTELLAITLNTGTHRHTAIDLARELLQTSGSLQQLAQSPPHLLMQITGIGPAKYAALMAAIELGRRSLHPIATPRYPLNNCAVTQSFLENRLRHHASEVFACLFLDTHLRLIAFEELFKGTVNQASVYPREIVKRSLYHNAANVILAHNHPSGHAFPSQADRDLTRLVRQALELVDIDVVDHIIIGHPDHFSFAETGLL